MNSLTTLDNVVAVLRADERVFCNYFFIRKYSTIAIMEWEKEREGKMAYLGA